MWNQSLTKKYLSLAGHMEVLGPLIGCKLTWRRANIIRLLLPLEFFLKK